MLLTRRGLLRGAGALTVAPFLERWAAAQPSSAPIRRVVVIFSPNGPQFERGPTEGTEHSFTLHDWWSPLERHKSKGLFFRNVHQAGVPFGEVDSYGHQSGGCGALTARTTEGTRTGTGPSIDQFIAQQLQQRGVVTPQRSLLMGLYDRGGPPWFEAAGEPVQPLHNPYRVLDALAPSFGSTGPSAAQALLQKRHFVLDPLAEDCRRLRQRLSGQGRAMLDAHCGNIESLEASVAEALTPGRSCQAPAGPIASLPDDANWNDRESRDAAMRAFIELTALSFACDITRVVGIGFGRQASRFAIPERYGVPSSGRVDSGDSGPQMHAWTHQAARRDEARGALRIFYHWFSNQVAQLLDALESTTDIDGRPLMETTLVLWTSEFGQGGSHHNGNVPVMLFGHGDGRFQTGRHFEAEGAREDKALVLHQLFVSMIRYMGLSDVDTFGNAGRGPLDWLEG